MVDQDGYFFCKFGKIYCFLFSRIIFFYDEDLFIVVSSGFCYGGFVVNFCIGEMVSIFSWEVMIIDFSCQYYVFCYNGSFIRDCQVFVMVIYFDSIY